jgi:DNA-binding NarL/FixJ family response regulator
MMSDAFLFFLFVPVLSAGAAHAFTRRIWERRIRALEAEVNACSDALCQLADTQAALHSKLTRAIGEIEERILDVAVPSRDSSLTLDRRHQVLALARRGVALDEISRRLNVPKGEAQLILNLRKYMHKGVAGAPATGDLMNHVQT